jgi:hypothetical protein
MTSTLRTVRRTVLLLLGLLVIGLAAGSGAYALFGREDAAAGAGAPVKVSIADWRWAPRDELPQVDQAAEPTAEEPRSEPVEEASEEPDETIVEPDPVPQVSDLPKSTGTTKDVLTKAEVLKNGVALPPLEAPAEVRAIFEAGNVIARSPYKWGGGHGKWQDTGYDCSGSVSYALAAGGFVDASMPSGGYMRWGEPGKGKWITIYSNPGHMYMVVAGVRFDTVARGQTGSRWINSSARTSGYVARHPKGY